MSESSAVEINGGQLQSFTIDQAAGAIALSLGALGSLLLVIWQSRCLCRCRIGLSDQCYLFDCSREPPPLEEDNTENEEQLVPAKKDKAEPEPELASLRSLCRISQQVLASVRVVIQAALHYYATVKPFCN